VNLIWKCQICHEKLKNEDQFHLNFSQSTTQFPVNFQEQNSEKIIKLSESSFMWFDNFLLNRENKSTNFWILLTFKDESLGGDFCRVGGKEPKRHWRRISPLLLFQIDFLDFDSRYKRWISAHHWFSWKEQENLATIDIAMT